MAPNLDTLLSRCEADLLQLWPNAKRGFVCPICLRFLHVQRISPRAFRLNTLCPML